MNLNQLPTDLFRRLFRMVCLGSEDWKETPSLAHHRPMDAPTGLRLHASALRLASVCSVWRDFVLSDPLLKVLSVQATSFQKAMDQLSEQIDAEKKILRLVISEPSPPCPWEAREDRSVGNTMAAQRERLQNLQTFHVSAFSQHTASEAFRVLATFDTHRLSQFIYRHNRTGSPTILRVPAFSLKAPYLTELNLEGVEASHPDSWRGFCQLCSSAPSLRRLYLSDFKTDISPTITKILGSDSDHIPDSASRSMQKLALLSLKELYLSGGTPSNCTQLLCHMEAKGLETLELLPGIGGSAGQSDLHLEALDWLHNVKRFKVAAYQAEVHGLLHSALLPSVTQLTVLISRRDIPNLSFPTLPELENLRIDAPDDNTNAILVSLSASGRHSEKLRSLTLAINSSNTPSKVFCGVDSTILSNIRSLTLFGRRLDGFVIDDICVEMPSVDVLRIVMPFMDAACIGRKGLEPHLYYDTAQSVALLPNMTHLAFFLQRSESSMWKKSQVIKTRDVYNLEKFLKDRNKEPGKFRHIERLVFNIPLAKTVRKSLAKYVDTVIDDSDGGDSEHPWKLEGNFDQRR